MLFVSDGEPNLFSLRDGATLSGNWNHAKASEAAMNNVLGVPNQGSGYDDDPDRAGTQNTSGGDTINEPFAILNEGYRIEAVGIQMQARW